MVRGFRDAKQFYGEQGGKRTTPKPTNTSASSKKDTKPSVKEETWEVKIKQHSGLFKISSFL